ncbi:hypothetical protein OAE64_00025 [bacterium]|nr:hypothetical protein [bacterium]
MKTAKLLLLFLVGVPIFGTKITIYLSLFLLSIPAMLNIRIKEYIVSFYVLVIPLLICELFVFQQLPIISLSIFFSIIIGYSNREFKIKSVTVVLTVLIVFQIISFYSIVNLGYDFVPDYLYGESRHRVGVNDFIQFRPSGIYQEPSTLAIYYIATLVILFTSKEKHKHKRILIAIAALSSVLTFSVISLISLVLLIIYNKRFIKGFLYQSSIAIISSLFIYHFVTSFVITKVSSYSEKGLDNYNRLQLVYKIFDNNWFIPKNLIKEGVAFDNGPLVFLFLFCGIYSIPMILYLVIKSKNNAGLLLMLITKISITYPLFWAILKNNEKIKNRYSNQ